MNYLNLLKDTKKAKAKVGILGANGAFGYSFLAQLPLMEKYITLRLVSDLDTEKSKELLIGLGYDRTRLCVCKTKEDIAKAPCDGILILQGSDLADVTDVDVIVEATGNPEISSVNAERCILGGKHVCMVSKEADCITGPYLYRLAQEQGVVYSIALGDQPGNLVDFCSWVKTLGLEVIAAGKSSEYDFVYDLDDGLFSFQGKSELLPALRKYWHYEGPHTLRERSAVLSSYPQRAVPDYCEMNIVCNALDLKPSCDHFHYPVCRISELAEIYIPVEDGGVLEKTGVVDVFNNFRRPDEASFAGGVFVMVKCTNDKVWKLLEEKGHVVSRSLKYACLYLPYHFMGVEAPMSVILAHYFALSSYDACKRNAVMVCRTERAFSKGEVLSLNTHHRVILDMDVSLQSAQDVPSDVAPYYLLAGKKLCKDIPSGVIVTQDMVDISGSVVKRMMDAIE